MELLRALACLAESPSPAAEPLAELLELGPLPREDAYGDLFLFQLYPYASVYLSPEGMLGGEARDRVAGFWRALGLVPPPEPDHLATMLAFYCRLREFEGDPATVEPLRQRWRHARTTFLREHLLSWLPFYLSRCEELAPDFYRGWARLLRQGLAAEAESLEELPSHLLPLPLREAPTLPDPRQEGGEAFLGGLSSPLRSGVILVRDDFTRAARELGLATRLGERRYVLQALLGQDAPGTLGWLAGEARRAACSHRQHQHFAGAIAASWSDRAETAAALVDDLARLGS